MAESPEPLDFVDVDHLLADEERAIRDTVREWVGDPFQHRVARIGSAVEQPAQVVNTAPVPAAAGIGDNADARLAGDARLGRGGHAGPAIHERSLPPRAAASPWPSCTRCSSRHKPVHTATAPKPRSGGPEAAKTVSKRRVGLRR